MPSTQSLMRRKNGAKGIRFTNDKALKQDIRLGEGYALGRATPKTKIGRFVRDAKGSC